MQTQSLPLPFMHRQWVPPYVQTAGPVQGVLQAGWLVGHCATWTQVQVVYTLASPPAAHPQIWWKLGFGLG
jgi:hypothetical protein